MPRLIVLLRGVNLAGRNRVAMPKLRAALEGAGLEEVTTYIASGNVVLSSRKSASRVAAEVERVVSEQFGIDVAAVVRTRPELARAVERNPFARVACDPRRLLVTFLAEKPKAGVVKELEALAVGGERIELVGRELYAWHPDGIGRSKLAARLAGNGLGVVGTARNWATVTKLLELAGHAKD